jgi:hypothetical protein
LKSSNGKNALDKANSEKGNGNGKGHNGFGRAEPLFDKAQWGMSFFGAGEALPGPGLYDRTDPKAKRAHEKESPRPKPEEKHPEFEVLSDGLFGPTEERCAW